MLQYFVTAGIRTERWRHNMQEREKVLCALRSKSLNLKSHLRHAKNGENPYSRDVMKKGKNVERNPNTQNDSPSNKLPKEMARILDNEDHDIT